MTEYIESKSLLAMIWTSWAGAVSYLLGGFDGIVTGLLILMALDYITGIWLAFDRKNLCSKVAYKGLRKKVLVLVILCGATVMDRIIPHLGVRLAVGVFYVATELLSVTENASNLGLPIPEKLKRALEQCKDSDKK